MGQGLNRKDAQSQAKRLNACPMLAPQSDEGRKEIVDCLMRNCMDADHAQRTMTLFLDTSDHIHGAVTAEIAIAARQTENNSSEVPQGCRDCWSGVGPDGKDKWEAWPRMVLVRGYEVSARCECERGKWLAERDRIRISETAQRRTA